MKTAAIALLLLTFCSNLQAANKETFGDWELYTESVGKQQSIFAALVSYKGEHATLALRCRKSELDFYMMFSDSLQIEMNDALAMQIESQPIVLSGWQRSAGGRGAFAVSPFNALNRLTNHQHLAITYNTQDGQHKAAEFNLDGVDQVIERIAGTCLENNQ